MQLLSLDALGQIAPDDWDALLPNAQPFLRHSFLTCLEDSQSLGKAQGWQVQHQVLKDDQGQLLAAVPGYLKSHSFGEYVFDMGWADACQRAGIAYYPKWLGAVPFSPIQGARLLGKAQHIQQLATLLVDNAKAQGLSGLHINFTDPATDAVLSKQGGWLERLGCQYHWQNPGYRDFQDFLERFTSRKRKQLRKERESVAAQGFSFEWRTGHEVSEAEWDFIYQCYANTYLVRGRRPYLTRLFFSLLAERMPLAIRVVLVKQGGALCAMALSLTADNRLYGRYWGALVEAPNLHFETCFYQGIEQAIAQRWEYFDAGAQGEHKLLRGFEPVLTRSWHWLGHAGLRAAVTDFLNEERAAVRQYAQEARAQLPYRVAVTGA